MLGRGIDMGTFALEVALVGSGGSFTISCVKPGIKTATTLGTRLEF